MPTYQKNGEWGEGSADIGDRWPNSSSTRNKLKKKKKGCSEHCTHSDDCKFHNCGDLPSHYTHTSTAASVHSSRKVKSGEDTKHKGCSALRKLVHKTIIQALVERKACRSEGLTGYYSLYINNAFLQCII